MILGCHSVENHFLSKDEMHAQLSLLREKVALFEQLQIERNAPVQPSAEKLLRDVFDNIGVGVLVIDEKYRIVLANTTFAQLANLSHKDVLGEHCYRFFHHKDRPCYMEGEKCPAKHTFATGEPSGTVYTRNDPGGNTIVMEIKSFPLKDISGKVFSVIETIRDITAQRKLEAQLCNAQKMEAMVTLVGGIAHDFNNLLNIIIGYSEMLRLNITEKNTTSAHLDEILMAANRATQLTRSLLAFSRKQIIEEKPLNINDLISSMRKRLTRILGKGREIKTALSSGDITINADPAQIEQVLMNLAINARDAMPEGGTFSIGTELVHLDDEVIMTSGVAQSGKFVIVSFSDTGVGMDEQTASKIYEPYFTTKGMDKGTGLGLSIVYGIIRQHNGFIDVASHPGKGTTFNIYLPATDRGPAFTQSSAMPATERGTELVLLVEDDSAARKVTKLILERLGYNVIEAVDGEDAIRKFSANRENIRLVILDVIMPQGSIKQVYEQMLLLRPDIKAIFISGYTEDILKKNGMIEEGLHFLPKPILPAKLSKKVREVLDT
jgi:PAS domain S-box-containing protein